MFKKVILVLRASLFLLSGIFATSLLPQKSSDLAISQAATPTPTPTPTVTPSPSPTESPTPRNPSDPSPTLML